jgi:nitroreductase
MEFAELVRKNRSYRRFDESVTVGPDVLRTLIDLARRTPSGMNRQPLKYIYSCSSEVNDRIFATLSWAGSLKDWPGPKEGERPAAYIVILLDKTISQTPPQDVGISAQTILFGAVEIGLGGCMLGAINKPALRGALQIAEEFEIALVIAIGEPIETIVLEDAEPGGDITYYRDPDGTHHVPKRTMAELVIQAHE